MPTVGALSFIWLEVTGRCQLECDMCYAESGPTGDHGTMTREDWLRVIDQAADQGVAAVKIIGGEPTLYPHLADLVTRALARQLRVEVLTNLVHVSDALWEVFARPGVSLATSYFADNAEQHDAITGRPSYSRTKANIVKAVRLGIPVRAGVIDHGGDQRAAQARDELIALGVVDIGYDRVRQIGRGARDQTTTATQLCGRCGDGVVAVGPHGEVRACVFARFTAPLGDIRSQPLDALRAGLPQARRQLVAAGMPARSAVGCDPETTGTNCYPHNRR